MATDKTYPSGLRRVGSGTPDAAHGTYGWATPDSIEAAINDAKGAASGAYDTLDNLTASTATAPAGSPASVSVTGPMGAKVLNFSIPRGLPGLSNDGAVQAAMSQQAGTAMRVAVKAGTVGLLVLGDSKTSGTGLTDYVNRYMNRLLAVARARFPIAGGDSMRGLIPANMSDPYDAMSGRPTTTGTTFPVDTAGLGYNARQLELGSVLTFPVATWPAASTLPIGYHTHSGASGTLQVLVDGVVQTEINCAGAGEGEPKRTSIPISAGTHTVSMRPKAGTAPVRVMYVEQRSAATGWHLYDAARPGMAAKHVIDGPPGAPAGPASFAKAVADLPSVGLAVVAFGANDMTISAPAEFGSDLLGVVNMVKAGHPKAGVLVVLPAALTDASAVVDDVQQYHTAARSALAGVPDLSVIAETQLIDLTGPNAGEWLADTVHPNAFGHDEIARALMGSLVGLDGVTDALSVVGPAVAAAAAPAVAAAQSAQADAAQSAADAEAALQAQFLTQDEGVAALIGTQAGPETRAALDAFVGESTATFRAALSESNTWQQNRDALNAAADAAEAAGGGRVIANPGAYDVKGVVVGSRVTLDMPGVTLRSPDGQAPDVISNRTRKTTATAVGAVVTVGDPTGFEAGALVAVHEAGVGHPAQSTYLTAGIDSSQTAMTLTATKGFPSLGTLRIEDELIKYTGRSGGVLSGVTRGWLGTTPAAHPSSAPIHLAHHHYGEVAGVVGSAVTLTAPVPLNVTGSDVTVGTLSMGINAGLTIDGNAPSGGASASVYGLTMSLARRSVVTGLTVVNGDMGGIMLMNNSRDNLLSSTTLVDCGIPGVKGGGLWCFAGASANLIDGLVVVGDIWTGIYVDDRTSTATPWDAPCDENSFLNFDIEHTGPRVGFPYGIVIVGSNRNRFAFGNIRGTTHGLKVEYEVGQTQTHDGSIPDCTGNQFSNIHVSGTVGTWGIASPGNFLHGMTFDDEGVLVDPGVVEGNLYVNSKMKRGEGIKDGVVHPLPGLSSSAAAGYAFEGKSNTGMYSDASNTVGLTAAGANVLRAFPTEIRLFQGPKQTLISSSGFVEFADTLTTGTPPAGKARLYTKTVGGVTQLCVNFPNGSTVVIASSGA